MTETYDGPFSLLQMFWGSITARPLRSFLSVIAIDIQSFNALSKGFLFRDGRPFEGPDEVIADDIIAQTRRLKVGSHITLLNHAFTVCGIVAHGKGARYFIPIRTA